MKRTLTPEQEAARAARREKFRALVKQVAAMSDEERAHLTCRVGAVLTCEGRALSLHNTCLLLMQCPSVSMVGGFRQWIKAGRVVRKGEHGQMIWLPLGAGKEADAETGEPGKEAGDLHFIIGTVFDVSQTQEIGQAVAA